MTRGPKWKDEQVHILLDTVRQSCYVRQLISSSCKPNKGIWQRIRSSLKKRGCKRSLDQCRTKWKTLKMTFFKVRKDVKRGRLPDARSFPFYPKMKSIWDAAERPRYGERRVSDVGNTEHQETQSNRRSEENVDYSWTVTPSPTYSERSWSNDEQPFTSHEQGGLKESLMQSLLRNHENFMTSTLKNQEKLTRDVTSILSQIMEQQTLVVKTISVVAEKI